MLVSVVLISAIHGRDTHAWMVRCTFTQLYRCAIVQLGEPVLDPERREGEGNVQMPNMNLSLSEDCWELVRREAFERNVSKTDVIRLALAEFFSQIPIQPRPTQVQKPKLKDKEELPHLLPRRI